MKNGLKVSKNIVKGVIMGDYILTYSKTKFFPLEPILEDIDILDIAHALSLMTRANGHFKHFYSVAQHSINCFREAESRGYSKKVQLCCLLHDASESYISDITRPVKKNLHEYYHIEARLQSSIFERYGITLLNEDEEKQISDVDDAMLYYEFLELMGNEIFDIVPLIYIKPDFSERVFSSVEKEFISSFNKLMGHQSDYSCIGIDACNGKWVAVHISNGEFDVRKFSTIDEICDAYPNCDSYIIDIPIGLPESKADLRPDLFVKKLLGKKGSSIFEVPCRQAIYSENKVDARNHNIEVMGKSLSEQSLGIAKAIKQIDEFLLKRPKWKNKLVESHPEFCFSKLNNDRPILEDKKTPAGQNARLDVLRRYYPHANQIVEKFLADVPYRKKADDVIDAMCLAVIGKEMIEKGIKTIPENPAQDSRGIIMQMVYVE
ncbi:putative RNase H-like nuclease [Desulfitobacterium sp. LBE]|uniref:DUF429 domain-containing protein n=1 Tax=Desulfitobacterium sp. LBE TaxID=884086 RepID=UPI0011998BCF|nr:putative RNase H-like nuclease [Desulfitobacterium sp. LBE]